MNRHMRSNSHSDPVYCGFYGRAVISELEYPANPCSHTVGIAISEGIIHLKGYAIADLRSPGIPCRRTRDDFWVLRCVASR